MTMVRMDRPAFDGYVARAAEVVRDPDDPRAVYVVGYDPLGCADCPINNYDDDLYAVPIRTARDFAVKCWHMPDDMEIGAMRDHLAEGELADAVIKHFARMGYSVRECSYSNGSMWADYVLAVPQDAGDPSIYEDELDAWLAGEAYTVTGWFFDGEEWREGYTFGDVYLTDYATREDDICAVGRDTIPIGMLIAQREEVTPC